MATQCPLCKEGTLKVGKDEKNKDNRVYCSNYKWEGGGNIGSCDFVLWFGDTKKGFFGKDLTIADVKKLLDGGVVVSPKGHKMTLDLDSQGYKKIETKPREEDRDL